MPSRTERPRDAAEAAEASAQVAARSAADGSVVESPADGPAAQGRGSALQGVRVIVTRTPDRGGSLLELLRERGAEPVLVPVQEAEPVEGQEHRDLLDLLEQAAGGAEDGEALWLVVTSANTVRALAQLAQNEHGRGLGELLVGGFESGLRVAAVGPATAAELEAHGVPVHLQPHRTSSAAGLLETWERPELGGPGEGPGTALLPQSAAAAPALARGLERLGWQVRHRVAYRMTPWPAQDPLVHAPASDQDTVWTASRARREAAAGRVDAAVLTAPSAARALGRDAASALRPLALAVIGEPTHAAVVELGLEAVVAPSTDPAGLLEALEKAVAAARSRDSPEERGIRGPEHSTAATAVHRPSSAADSNDSAPQEDRDDRSH